jgi:hypothetical protein
MQYSMIIVAHPKLVIIYKLQFPFDLITPIVYAGP